ncbi:MAG: hypothetical protein JKY82_05605 [Rhizobiaceae bacterium]|nr:hypothetical protein [Rhizobiaceae bacterium]
MLYTTRNLGIFGLIFNIVALTLVISVALSINFILVANYRYEEYYTTPAFRYFYFYILILFLLFVSSLFYARKYRKTREKPIKLYWIIRAIIFSIPCYMLSAQVTLDIPNTLYLNGDRYDIPWEFRPSGTYSGGKEYVGFSTSYPEFSQPNDHKKKKSTFGYSVRIAKRNSLDGMCIGIFGGCVFGPGIPKSTLPATEQLKKSITDHLNILPNTSKIQSIWVGNSEEKTQYFYQNGILNEPRTYGSCIKKPGYIVCDYVIADGSHYYSVSMSTMNPGSIYLWDEEKVLPIIERETKKLFDSFLNR